MPGDPNHGFTDRFSTSACTRTSAKLLPDHTNSISFRAPDGSSVCNISCARVGSTLSAKTSAIEGLTSHCGSASTNRSLRGQPGTALSAPFGSANSLTWSGVLTRNRKSFQLNSNSEDVCQRIDSKLRTFCSRIELSALVWPTATESLRLASLTYTISASLIFMAARTGPALLFEPHASISTFCTCHAPLSSPSHAAALSPCAIK